MKVLIVHPCKGFYGGAEEVVVQLTRYLVGNGHDVQIVTKDAPKELFEGITDKKGQPAVYDWGSWRMMRWWTQKLSGWADVVNVHNFPATLTTFPKRVPTVYMCNEPAELFTNWWRKPIEAFNRWWVRKSGMKIVVADQVNAQRFFKIYGVEPAIIPYGVDYEFWSKVDSRKESRLTILQVGHSEFFAQGKQIFAEVQKEIPEAVLVQLTRKSHEEVRYWYGKAHVLLHPVRSQGGWLVPFEAMCARLPVVTTQEFSASSLITRNRLGIVTLDPSEVILQRRYEELDTKAIREWVKENSTWEKFGESMVKVFEEALNV